MLAEGETTPWNNDWLTCFGTTTVRPLVSGTLLMHLYSFDGGFVNFCSASFYLCGTSFYIFCRMKSCLCVALSLLFFLFIYFLAICQNPLRKLGVCSFFFLIKNIWFFVHIVLQECKLTFYCIMSKDCVMFGSK